jgi:3-oxoacyl-[acyl-carrier protein] reductase
LAKEGEILVARTQEELDNVAAKARSLRVKALAVTADVADINSVNAAVETALAEFGTIDILINNAGIAAFGKFLELEPMGAYHPGKLNGDLLYDPRRFAKHD